MLDFPHRPGGWPCTWPGGTRIVQARPLAVRVEEAPWHSGLSPKEIDAFHEAGQLPFIELGEVRLVLVRDLEALLSGLSRAGEEPPAPPPPPPKRRRRRHLNKQTVADDA